MGFVLSELKSPLQAKLASSLAITQSCHGSDGNSAAHPSPALSWAVLRSILQWTGNVIPNVGMEMVSPRWCALTDVQGLG